MHAQRGVQNINAQHNKYYKTNIHATTTKPRSQSIADIPQGPDLSDMRGPVLDLFFKFGTNSLQGFPTLTFSFLSVVHLLNVYEVIAHNICVHWISASFKYLRVSSKIKKNDQENGFSCIENISIFFSKTPGVWTLLQPEHWDVQPGLPSQGDCAWNIYLQFQQKQRNLLLSIKVFPPQRR